MSIILRIILIVILINRYCAASPYRLNIVKYLFLLYKMSKPLTEKSVGAHQREQAPIQQVARRELESLQLFDGAKELLIRHDGECYTLRHTSKGKLILTK